jgi:hypothetical protein
MRFERNTRDKQHWHIAREHLRSWAPPKKRTAGYFVVAMRKRGQAGRTWKNAQKLFFICLTFKFYSKNTICVQWAFIQIELTQFLYSTDGARTNNQYKIVGCVKIFIAY